MKKLILSVTFAALACAAVTGAAADGMPRGGSIKDSPATGPSCGSSTYNWNGMYGGLLLGAANSRTTIDTDM